MTLTNGWKTYLAGAALIAAGIAKLLGVELPGFEMMDAGALIGNGLGFIGLRNALPTKE